jgi:hypothetical protein
LVAALHAIVSGGVVPCAWQARGKELEPKDEHMTMTFEEVGKFPGEQELKEILDEPLTVYE